MRDWMVEVSEEYIGSVDGAPQYGPHVEIIGYKELCGEFGLDAYGPHDYSVVTGIAMKVGRGNVTDEVAVALGARKPKPVQHCSQCGQETFELMASSRGGLVCSDCYDKYAD